jgi:hypothetical protein
MVTGVNPADFASTREALHAVCEHVLAPALYAATGRIGLRVTPAGFATPQFGADDRVITLGADRLTVTDRTGSRSAPYPTLQAAAQLVGIEPGLPEGIYPPATTLIPDAPLGIDAPAAGPLLDWYVKVSEALSGFAPGSTQTLWPEHSTWPSGGATATSAVWRVMPASPSRTCTSGRPPFPWGTLSSPKRSVLRAPGRRRRR